MSPAQIAAGIARLTAENARLRTADLATIVRTSPEAARELRDMLAAPSDGFRIALWDMDPYGQQNAGRYEPAPVCTSLTGRRLGWVAYTANAYTTPKRVRIPAGWACWANVTGGLWPYHQPCDSQAHGLQLVTAALIADGWAVHPLPALTSAPEGHSGADPAAGVGVSSEVSDAE